MQDNDAYSSNPSDNRAFADVVAEGISRRTILQGSLGAAAIGFLAGAPAASASTNAGTTAGSAAAPAAAADSKLLGFKGIATSTDDVVKVPEGYVVDVIIPWGTPLFADGPAWMKNASNSALEQTKQVGMHHDGMHFFPFDTRGRMRSRGDGHEDCQRGLLVLNHEYVDPELITTDGIKEVTLEKVRKAQHAHGVTVINVEQGKDGRWDRRDSEFNRRIHVNTPVAFSGPVSIDHPKMKAKTAPRGTLNNCSMGWTPWGTYLTCEENWHQYFSTTEKGRKAGVEEKRYNIPMDGTEFRWHEVDDRFDVAKDPNEPHRFGWVVEIDPFDPDSTPVKRTALGRFKHENACVTEARGRVVLYSGDDQDQEYIYKFVTNEAWRTSRMKGKSPLDAGTLYVAKFEADGTGTWIPLVFGQGKLTKANGWADQADVLLRTRTAADASGATKMDRPEWIAENPKTGHLFCTLTNGTAGPHPANPRGKNPYGHIIRWEEKNGDKTGTEFSWDIFVLAGDPKYDPMVNIKGDIFGSPDGLYFDDDGRLWIQTDVSNSSQLLPEKGYDRIGNNQMLVADPSTREIRRFLTGPKGCEVTGVHTTPDQKTMFVNIQHPGEDTKAIGKPTPANPRAVSNWPDHDAAGRPRSATLVIRKKDGGKIGS